MRFFGGKSGQSLIEMLIAISIVTVALLGILVLVNRAVGLNRVTADHYTGTYLAAEGIELVKNLFDKKFLESAAGSRSFYGWSSIQPGVYYMSYDDLSVKTSRCSISGEPTQSSVRDLLFSCQSRDIILYKSANGFLKHDQTAEPSKFKRVIIVDKPSQYSGPLNLEFRVTSAVGWETRGGKFVVQLQDHFLPWRLP